MLRYAQHDTTTFCKVPILGMHIIGITNVTPDSFSGDGRLDVQAAVAHALQLLNNGADILDIGGESTRPGSQPVDTETEIQRVVPVVQGILRAYPQASLSIDTSKAAVADAACQSGVHMINDVTAGADPDMFLVAARHHVQLVLMHNATSGAVQQGTQGIAWQAPSYEDVVAEVADYLLARAAIAMQAGVRQEHIIIDPGLGFGKNVADNLAIMRGLPQLTDLGFPLYVAASNKSFIGETLQVPLAERHVGNLACVAQSFFAGAAYVRVHDVRATRQLVTMLQAVR